MPAVVAIGLGLCLLASDLASPLLGSSHPAAVLAHVAVGKTCHQLPERSLTLGGRAMSACARCAGLHASGVVGGFLLVLFPAAAWGARRLALLGLSPLLLDVAAGQLSASWDHPWLRVATGLLAGTALLLSLRVANLRARRPEAQSWCNAETC